MAQPNIIRAGLVGFGTACSIFHAPLLQSSPRFQVTHVFERSSSKSEVLEPRVIIVRSMEELLAAPIDLVVIATPTSLHFEQAKQAMLAKKHVVVDKPLCVTAAEAQALYDLSVAQGVVFSVFHNRRWDSDFLTVRSLIDSGRLGELTRYEAHFDRFRPTLKHYWKETAMPGAGMLYDLGAHLVDQALQLFGVPDAVQSVVEIQREGAENDDYFRLEFKYNARPNLHVILTAGMLVKESGPKFIVEGTQGRFEKYGEDVQEATLREGKTPANFADWGLEPASTHGMLTKAADGAQERIESSRGSYEAFYANLADVIQSGAALRVHPREVVDQIRILENAKTELKRNIRHVN